MIIAHDLGTTGNKASLHRTTGELLNSVTVSYETSYGPHGEAEQDPRRWYAAVVEATRALIAEVDARQVIGMVMSGQMMGAVLLDHDHQPVRPALIWADTRSTAQAERLIDAFGQDRAYPMLGHQLNPTYSLSKIMWVAEHEPAVYERVRHFCLAKDFVVHQLTGRLVTDRSDASSTNAYDQQSGRWSQELITLAGIDPAIFPEIVDSTEVVGTLTTSAAEELGLHHSVQVVIGGGDGPIAAAGVGVTSAASPAYAYLGSSSWVSLASAEPIHDPQRRSMTFDHVVPGHYVPTATMVAGGASVEWAAEVFDPDGGSTDRVAALLDGVDRVRAAADGLYFLPHLMGERSPYWNPMASGGFLGVQRQHDRPQLLRAVLEGVAFNLRTNLQAFTDAGHRIDQVDAIGGGAASDAWLQIMADIWGISVRRRSIVADGNSLGAAVTGLVGLGHLDFSAAAGLSRVTAEFTPDHGRHEDYAERHAIFLDAYRALEGWSAGRHGGRR